MEIIAHRGSSAIAPENTISAIEIGIKQESNFIEIDVQMTKDGKIIALHDETIDRTTNGKGKIGELSFDDIKELSAGKWFDDKFKEQKIPLLSQILNLDFKNSSLIIEVKNVGNIYPGIEKKIIDIIRKSIFKNKVILKSFSSEVLERFHKLAPEYETLYVTIGSILNFIVIDDWIRFGTLYDFKNIKYLQVHQYLVNQKTVKKTHAKGLKLIAWGVNTKKRALELKELGVDLIETDYPNLLKN